MIVYCTGKIKNDGNISMDDRASYAEGQNIYLFKNSNETFEFVPKLRSVLVVKKKVIELQDFLREMYGKDGSFRACGGGSAGSYYWGKLVQITTNSLMTTGTGGAGGSYGGGTGGGLVVNGINREAVVSAPITPMTTGEPIRHKECNDTGGLRTLEHNYVGGGLLIVYALQFEGMGKFSSNRSNI